MSARAEMARTMSPARRVEQRERVRRAFGALREQLAACRRDPDGRLTVSDLESFQAFLRAHCEERQFVRELVAAGRVDLVTGDPSELREPVTAEWWRRRATYWGEYWEGTLRGAAEAAGPSTAGARALTPQKEITEAILLAEKAAALAMVAGARYPEAALDKAWRQVLETQGGPAEDGAAWLDTLAACREAMELAAEVTERALGYVARGVNTASVKGASPEGGSLVVFSLSGRREVAEGRARIALSGALASGFELVDADGHVVRYQLVSASRMGEANWVEISFSVADLPCVGYATYLLRPTDHFPEPASLSEMPTTGGSATALQTPVQAGPLPAEFDLVSVDAPGITLVAVKACGERELLVRAQEHEGRAVNAVAVFGGELRQAWRAEARERRVADIPAPIFGWRRAARLPLTLGPWECASLVVEMKALAEASEPAEIGPSADGYSPIYARYWDHNLGAAPMGDLPLGVWVDGTLPPGHNTRFPMCLSNDGRDREFVGSVRVLAPEGWTILPRQVPYRLAPGAHALYELVAIVPENASPSFLRFETEDGERTIQDVLPVGEILPLEISLLRDAAGFTVSIANPNPDYVEGQVALITPPEAWGRVAGEARAAVNPRMQPFLVEANGATMARFAAEGDASGVWAVARVAWYGQVQYVREAD